MIISGAGSRQLTNESTELKGKVFEWTRMWLMYLNPERVIAGGAEGFDHCLFIAAYHLDIPVDLYIPESGYGRYYWQQNSVTKQDRHRVYELMLSRAASVEYICDNPLPKGAQNFKRNEAMVDAADRFLVYDSTSRGTKHAVDLMMYANKPYHEYGKDDPV